MKERYSRQKISNIFSEDKYFDDLWLQARAKVILDGLTRQANEEVFSQCNAVLTYTIPWEFSANASAGYINGDPLAPCIEINIGMIHEIYRDAFVFTLMSERFADETEMLKVINKKFEGERFVFERGNPIISPDKFTRLFKEVRSEYQGVERDPEITENILACRFIMFELQLVWTFFHELTHLTQRHDLLRERVDPKESIVYEVLGAEAPEDSYEERVRFQAREILADIGGVELTVKYLLEENLFSYRVVYLFFCAQICMFNRFYGAYEDNLEFAPFRHPHPVVRNEFSQIYTNELVAFVWGLINKKRNKTESVDYYARPVTYASVRATVLSGTYWANRYETFDGESLPSFMGLGSGAFSKEREAYSSILRQSMLEQLKTIEGNHLVKDNAIDFLLSTSIFASGFKADVQPS